MASCSIKRCQAKVWSRGMCRKHYDHWRNSTGYRKPTREERFWAKVKKTKDCWIWCGPRDRQGYGRFRDSPTTNAGAHRYAYELLVGRIPDGLTIDHLCRNTSCVRPDHLEPVTGIENYRRSKLARTHCKRGHPFDEQNTYLAKNGARQCRRCEAAKQRRYRTERRGRLGQTCKEKDCDDPVSARGLCGRHYQRWRRAR
jgi:hypothetical protein